MDSRGRLSWFLGRGLTVTRHATGLLAPSGVHVPLPNQLTTAIQYDSRCSPSREPLHSICAAAEAARWSGADGSAQTYFRYLIEITNLPLSIQR